MRAQPTILRIILGILLIIETVPALAQAPEVSVRVVVTAEPPYVIRKDDKLSGFSIDLWDAIAARLKLKTTYQIAPNLGVVIETMRAKKADVIAIPAFYSTDRDKEFDFTFAVLDAGLQIMVPYTGQTVVSASPLSSLIRLIVSPQLLVWIGVGALLILIPAHIMWSLDRGTDDSISPTRRYIPGIFHTLVWAATGLVSQTQQLPKQHFARIIALIWMFVGVVFVAFYTAQLTASLTVQQIRGSINGLEDLPGKRVAVFSHSLAVDQLKKLGADVREFPTTDEMVAALFANKVDAVVTNSPLLRYYASHGGAGKVKIVGDEFFKNDLGFIVQLHSPLRRQIDSALISLEEDGTYHSIFVKWFGGP